MGLAVSSREVRFADFNGFTSLSIQLRVLSIGFEYTLRCQTLVGRGTGLLDFLRRYPQLTAGVSCLIVIVSRERPDAVLEETCSAPEVRERLFPSVV
jgi:hypothetical protein